MKKFTDIILFSRKCAGELGALGIGALDFGFDFASNYFQGKMDVQNSKELMDYQSNKYLDMQSRLNQNLYPQQISSMRMAGLNPAMIKGPMSQSASQPSATMNKQAARMDLVGAASAAANLELMDSQKQLNLAQAQDLLASARNKNEDTQYKSFLNDTFWDNYVYEKSEQASRTAKNNAERDRVYQSIDNLRAEYDNLVVTLDNLKKQGRLTEVQIENAKKVASAEVSKLLSESELNKGENKRRNDLNKWTVEVESSRVANTDMDTWMKREYMRLTREQVKIIQEYGADSQQAQIIGTYVNAFANALNAGANVANAAKNPVSGFTTTTENYDSNGSFIGGSVSTRRR